MSDSATLARHAAQFKQEGFLHVPALYDDEEVRLLRDIGRADHDKQLRTVRDAQGLETKLWLTSDTEREDIYNGFCHGHRMVDTMEALLEDEVYLYHYKMTVKEPQVGGAWEWHQDYGYWYNNDCLFPNMASCYIAVDRAHKGNGCLQVIGRSHLLGRLDHGTAGSQTGADAHRVELALANLELIYCEMQPGDALFFHCNLLHRSDANLSPDPRWGLICCYNARHNPCSDLPGHPSYRPLEKWDDSRIKGIGRQTECLVGS
ncbi:MAG TPA: phytanoyl-CoA dioxygenase family protein [Armatimonadota bacterium]|jgi:hypothetical protein